MPVEAPGSLDDFNDNGIFLFFFVPITLSKYNSDLGLLF